MLSCMPSHLELAKNVPHGDQQTERIVLHTVEVSGMRWCGRSVGCWVTLKKETTKNSVVTESANQTTHQCIATLIFGRKHPF